MQKRIEIITGCLTKRKCGWGYIINEKHFTCTHPKRFGLHKKMKITEVEKIKFMEDCPLVKIDDYSGLFIPGEKQNIMLTKNK